MPAPSTTIWTLDPHSRAKHAILGRYLRAWTPILGQSGFREIVYIDGFAGPGRYSDGSDGSPIIALRAALSQPTAVAAHLRYIFVEKDPLRAACLREIVDSLPRPENVRAAILGDTTFERAYTDVIRPTLVGRDHAVIPTFAFIDPFGWSGVPFSIVRDVLSRSSSEVLVTFMYEEINRFLSHPDQEENFDRYFGSAEWRRPLSLTDRHERNRALHDLYLEQLRTQAGARYVRSFQMRNQNDVTDYYLFFATNHKRGIQRMKEAMWKVDRTGEFMFSDATVPGQQMLFGEEPDYSMLSTSIRHRFAGTSVSVATIEEYVLAETPFRETHYKKQVLAPLELHSPPLIRVRSSRLRRPGTFADQQAIVEFAPYS